MGPARRVAIVTGVAEPEGIGLAVARALAAEGAAVIAVDRRAPSLADGDADGLIPSGTIAPLVADLTDPAAVDALFEHTRESYRQLDILVNCASIMLPDDCSAPLASVASAEYLGVTSCTMDQWRAILAHHLDAAFLCSRAAAQQFAQQRSGCIVNVASLAGRRGVHPAPLADSGPQAVAEAGLLGLTKQLAIELAPYGVRVNAVVPGLVATRRQRTALDSLSAPQREARLREVPLGRVGTPDEVASLVVGLCGDAASYLMGATIDVNGGAFRA